MKPTTKQVSGAGAGAPGTLVANDGESQNSMVRLQIESNQSKPNRRRRQCWLSPAKKDTVDKLQQEEEEEAPVERLTCVICRLPVKGLINMCLRCNHGGHALHMQDWFVSNETCPRGCGCTCIIRRRKVSDEGKQSTEGVTAAGAAPTTTNAATSTSAGNSEFRGAKNNNNNNTAIAK